ncbi:hypothetical protein [Nostoc sp. CHAB 5715]|uniref:hypothetical protein n=1 Tax=Nostoc sp. CHAB 5715 TaxID=2780400 RepID=UPI001E5A0576|nr:hypothetical protein [Nostoc sp. CHAB 5715]MCC5624052.1 hypothetical protein [Nostoc sp. CHAB 5715]
MLNIEIGSGFAVELFIIFFSLLCWLVTPESSTLSKRKVLEEAATDKKIQESILNSADLFSPTKSLADFGKRYLGSVDEIIENLSLNEARKVASKLKDLKVISPDIKLSGKGIGKDFLIALIKGKVFEYRETIASTLTQVLGRTIA